MAVTCFAPITAQHVACPPWRLPYQFVRFCGSVFLYKETHLRCRHSLRRPTFIRFRKMTKLQQNSLLCFLSGSSRTDSVYRACVAPQILRLLDLEKRCVRVKAQPATTQGVSGCCSAFPKVCLLCRFQGCQCVGPKEKTKTNKHTGTGDRTLDLLRVKQTS